MSNGNKLNKIHDAYQILSNLSKAKEDNCEVYVWRFVGGAKHLGLCRIEAIRKQRNDFCIVPTEGQDRIIQELVSGQTQIDFYIPSMCLLMRCQVKQTDAPFRYYLGLPEFIAQVERRQSMRLNVYEQEEMKVSFGKTITLPKTMSQFFLKSCVDVSTGGISFYVSKTEAKLFRPEDAIPAMELKSKNFTAKFASQVQNVREIEPDEVNGFSYKVWRVSCQITQMDPVAKKQLERFIFERIKDELRAINF